MNASSMPPNCPLSDPAMAPAERSGVVRSSNGASDTKTMPAFELLVKPLMDRPGKAMLLTAPGCFSAMSPMRLMTASLRSRLAPSGSWAKPTRYCLSWAGTKPPGTAWNSAAATPTSPR